MIKLVCPECRRENEPERIYCHDCGARLDRSALAKVKPKEEDPKATQRRLRSMFDPRWVKMRLRFFQICKLVLGAVAAAIVVQMLRAPDVPPAKTEVNMPTPINLEMENLILDPRLAPLHYSTEQVNGYLAYTLKGRKTQLNSYTKFERALVDLQEGFFRFTVQRSVSGLPLCATGIYGASLKDGNISVTNYGGSIGRMPIHPALMKYGGFLFADVRAALERERKSISKLGAFELHPQLLVLNPKQLTQAPPPPPAAAPAAPSPSATP